MGHLPHPVLHGSLRRAADRLLHDAPDGLRLLRRHAPPRAPLPPGRRQALGRIARPPLATRKPRRHDHAAADPGSIRRPPRHNRHALLAVVPVLPRRRTRNIRRRALHRRTPAHGRLHGSGLPRLRTRLEALLRARSSKPISPILSSKSSPTFSPSSRTPSTSTASTPRPSSASTPPSLTSAPGSTAGYGTASSRPSRTSSSARPTSTASSTTAPSTPHSTKAARQSHAVAAHSRCSRPAACKATSACSGLGFVVLVVILLWGTKL